MAPRGRKKKTGLRREDAARDRMKVYGFDKHIIEKSLKEVVKVYGEDQWFLIEDDTYCVLLSVCLEKQEEQAKQLAAEEQAKQLAEEMAEKEKEEKKADVLVSITSKAVMNSAETKLAAEEQDETGQEEQKEEKKAGKAVMDFAGYAYHSVEVGECSQSGCIYISSDDEETTSDSDSD